jgi:hypothetical protein
MSGELRPPGQATLKVFIAFVKRQAYIGHQVRTVYEMKMFTNPAIRKIVNVFYFGAQ